MVIVAFSDQGGKSYPLSFCIYLNDNCLAGTSTVCDLKRANIAHRHSVVDIGFLITLAIEAMWQTALEQQEDDAMFTLITWPQECAQSQMF